MSPDLAKSIAASLTALRATAAVCFNEPTPDVTAASVLARAIVQLEALKGANPAAPKTK